MTRPNLEEMSKEALISELDKAAVTERRIALRDQDREALIHNLRVHQVELEMQNRELREAQERVEEITSRYSDLYDFAPVGYCTLLSNGKIRELNLTAATLLGGRRETLVGNHFSSVAPLKERQHFRAHMRQCLAGAGRVTSELAFSAGKRDARTVQIISEPDRSETDADTTYRTILVDISDLKAMESRLRLLSTAGERLTSSVGFNQAMEEAARIAVPALCDICMIDVVSTTGALQRKMVLFADPEKQLRLADSMMHITARSGWQTPQARVVASSESMLISEVVANLHGWVSDDDRGADTMRSAGIVSLMVVPLVARGRTLGALTLATAESERRYSLLDLQVAQDLSSRFAVALDNARLYDDTQRANAALRLSEAKSSGIVSTAVDAIICIDENQRIGLFNEGAERIFGYAQDEVLGASLDTLIPERYRAIHRQHLMRFAAGKAGARRMGERDTKILGLRKNGEEFPAEAAISKLEVSGETILTVVLRDVTDAKRFETDQKLLAEIGPVLASSLNYEETVTMLAQLVVRQRADYCLIDVMDENGAVRRLGADARDPAKRWVCDLLKRTAVLQDRPQFVWTSLETRKPILIEHVTPEVIADWAQGPEHLRLLEAMAPQSLMVIPMIAHEKLLGCIKVVASTGTPHYGQNDLRLMEEVAHRAALALDNARLYRVAERAIQARDEVLGVVAHDLRNPLGNILFQLALLQRPHGEIERRSRKPTEAIDRAAKRMNHLIQDLLDIKRMEAGQISIEPVSLSIGKVLSEFLEVQKPLISSKSLQLKLDIAPDLGEIRADRDRLLQVLENLVENAIKFTKVGGTLTVGAASRTGELLFWVADTGVGIPNEDIHHIFDRLWQARKTGRQGVGLGLSIVKGIVEAHGGRVWVESALEEGSTFFFTLPRANAR